MVELNEAVPIEHFPQCLAPGDCWTMEVGIANIFLLDSGQSLSISGLTYITQRMGCRDCCPATLWPTDRRLGLPPSQSSHPAVSAPPEGSMAPSPSMLFASCLVPQWVLSVSPWVAVIVVTQEEELKERR